MLVPVGVVGGYRAYTHDGDTLGHHSVVALYPDAAQALFLTSTGANANGVSTVRELAQIYAFDLFSGRQPWLNITNSCNFPCSFVHCEDGAPTLQDHTLLQDAPVASSTLAPSVNIFGAWQQRPTSLCCCACDVDVVVGAVACCVACRDVLECRVRQHRDLAVWERCAAAVQPAGVQHQWNRDEPVMHDHWRAVTGIGRWSISAGVLGRRLNTDDSSV